ncbi:FKBP-type peptidyl-prolyl cis-trans isomerase [Telluribacter sp. SYSU D00476]|uniref:FKBP-type peptidyl-prolyl cis-trans isomerase n=1 Tax=Telluribacter sp. SYSU D00476 TaxID=2811430 RepID=UPI001FF324C0|nr:FKBP-type peptidyl-prolyl cis-trans isomerase [Telluribacter sp. SYSU D00476]
MKKNGLLLLTWMFIATSCQKGDPADCDLPIPTTKAPQSEVAALKQHIDTSGINATADERGFYYTIHSPGTGAKPALCSDVTVNYMGTLTNGSTFETADDVSFNLSGLILGWQQGISLISPGGSITLYLPPSLAYGSQAQQGIPANSILIFKIDLISID